MNKKIALYRIADFAQFSFGKHPLLPTKNLGFVDRPQQGRRIAPF